MLTLIKVLYIAGVIPMSLPECEQLRSHQPSEVKQTVPEAAPNMFGANAACGSIISTPISFCLPTAPSLLHLPMPLDILLLFVPLDLLAG